MSVPKETNFFATDITVPARHDKERYLALFSNATGYERVGEASVWYLYSRNAAERIGEFCPNSKIIAMLRNPTEMIYSYHSQRIWNHTEDITDFAEALNAIDSRREGLRLPENPYPPECLDYWAIAKYSAQLRRYFEIFGRQNVHVIIFDDFKADPLNIYQEVFSFLGVDETFRVRLDNNKLARNANKRPISKAASRFLRSPPNIVLKFGRFLFSNQKKRRKLLFRLGRLNTRALPRPPLDDKLRNTIIDYYRDEIRELSTLLHRDLSRLWFSP